MEINQLEHIKRERGTASPFPFPFPPCHHPRITGAIGRTGCDLYVCFWRGVLINSHERGPSIQLASRDALQWVGLLSSPVHKNLSIEKKGGWFSQCEQTQMMPLDWVPALGEKRLQQCLKWFKRCRRELPCKSCLGITLEENGEVKCQASHHSIVCKIALNSVSAVDVKTKDVEHSFVTWWGSMCCGGAWGQEVHQTSHAALHHEKACDALNY